MKVLTILSLCLLGATSWTKAVPTFRLSATDGTVMTTQSLGKRSTLVVFLSIGCPHNPGSISGFNQLSKKLKGKANLVAFVNGGLAETKAYAKKLKTEFPMIADPGAKTMVAFGARHSLDMTLISGKSFGEITDGYSRGSVATLLKQAALPRLDLSFLPAENQSGCGI